MRSEKQCTSDHDTYTDAIAPRGALQWEEGKMKILDHPVGFKSGTRVLMLKGRHKDGLTNERTILRVAHSEDQFDRILEELSSLSMDGERIYAPAGSRSVSKAIREFKRRQLDNDYAENPEAFYRDITSRWTSCLMAPSSQREKFWIFDCDDERSVPNVLSELSEH